ncbi:MAG: hypothetical protein EA409_10545 [Saprospirales bacterium]|nr:MAG: hypothetical protein EA409_10545 [Saprospirales bacterium]
MKIFNCFSLFLLLLSFILLPLFNGTSIGQPLDAPYGCHHIHNNFHQWGVFTHRTEEAQKVIRRSDTLNLFHYEIHLDVTDFSNSNLRARTLVFLESLMDSVETITLDLEGLEVDSVRRHGLPLTYSHDGRYLRISEENLLSKGDTVYVEVFYGGTPMTCPSGFGGFYFEDGYAYNLGIGLAANPHNFGRAWIPCFDNFVQRSTFEFHVKSSGGRKAFCVGRFLGEQELGGDTIIRSYLMEQPIPTYLSSVAISNYRTMNWTHEGAYGPVEIELVARSSDLANFRSSVEDMEAALDALEYWYGPYPFERIGYVITTRGAMEHPTNTAYPANSIAGGQKSTRLMAHELCHHWWGNITTLTTAMDMWIKEGPAEYGAHLTQEWIGGFEGLWNSVRNNHQATIRTAHVNDGGYFALSPMPATNTYGRHTYIRGASMIHNLRGYLGDSLFRHSMQEVLNNNYFSHINAHEFRDALSEYSGKDMTDFFDDWIFAPGYSDFSIDSFRVIESHNGQYLTEVHFRQQQYNTTHYHNNVPLQVTFGNHLTTRAVRLTGSGAFSTDTIWLPFTPDWVVLNDRQLLNMASFSTLNTITETGDINDPHTGARLTTHSIEDTVLFFIEHHYTAPQPVKSEDPDFRLSVNHYFKMGGTFDESWDAQLVLRYNGRGTFPLDADLTSITEDSLILVYRPSPELDWEEYPYYTKNIFVPNDGNGFINIHKILPGEYAFANSYFRDPTNVTEISDSPGHFTFFPNPADNELHIKSGGVEGRFNLSIYDMNGRLLKKEEAKSFLAGETHSLNISKMESGSFLLLIESFSADDFTNIYEGRIFIKK